MGLPSIDLSGTLTFIGINPGTATITVTAIDNLGAMTTQSFTITIEPSKDILVEV